MPNDISQQVCEQIKQAHNDNHPISIHGSHSHDFMLPDFSETLQLDMSLHQGIIDYQPTELTIRAHSGTRLEEIQHTLSEKNQRLATDFPLYDSSATLGGAVAIGHTGSARPFHGAIRDHILGTSLVNPTGEIMHFGGQVMKNVAGYDVSRLLAGSRGTLGPILEITLKVLPTPEHQTTLCLPLDENSAIQTMNQLAGESIPVSASVFYEQMLYLRLEGTKAGIQHYQKKLNASEMDDSELFWNSIQRQQHAFFTSDIPLWRVIVPATTPTLELEKEHLTLVDWCGGLRWVQAAEITQADYIHVSNMGGYIESFRGNTAMNPAELMSSLQQQMHHKIKMAFDPDNSFNPVLSNFTIAK